MAALSSGRVASADPQGGTSSERALATSLSWVRLPGAEGCIDSRTLAEGVERRLGRVTLVPPSRADRAIEGRVEPGKQGAKWRVTLAVVGESGAVLGTREIEEAAADCRAMDDTLALVIALMIDPDSALAAVPPSSALIPPPAVAAPPPPPPPPRPPSPPPPRRFQLAMRGGPTFSLGLLPSVGAGVALRVTVVPPVLFPFEVGGVLWAEQRVTSPGGTFGADVWMAFGTVAACPLHGELRGFFWASCAGVEVGAAHVGGFGFEVTRAEDVVLANVSVGAQLRRNIVGPVFGALGLGLSVPFLRLDLYYQAGGQLREAFTAPPLAGTMDLALGVELR